MTDIGSVLKSAIGVSAVLDFIQGLEAALRFDETGVIQLLDQLFNVRRSDLLGRRSSGLDSKYNHKVPGRPWDRDESTSLH
ncbi:MAG: hypothetical protein AAF492_14265 [Verrucomicrobiota bacterium]